MERQLGVVWGGDGLRVGWGTLVGRGGSWCGREKHVVLVWRVKMKQPCFFPVKCNGNPNIPSMIKQYGFCDALIWETTKYTIMWWLHKHNNVQGSGGRRCNVLGMWKTSVIKRFVNLPIPLLALMWSYFRVGNPPSITDTADWAPGSLKI